jgi:FtsH-binding integral membrane protein
MILTIYFWSAVIALAFCVWRILIMQQEGSEINIGIALFRCSAICLTPILNTIFSIGVLTTFAIASIQKLIKLYRYVKKRNKKHNR